MPYQAQAVDAIEPVSDTVWELAANVNLYNVVSGCAATYSAANMTKTIAAGVITHNGSSVTVAGNSVTLVSDPSNPRWTWTGINSGGTAVIVSGDPLATPLVPELGDLVAVSLDLVQAGQTIANNVVTQLDKRIPGAAAGVIALAGSSTAATSTTSTVAVDLVTISGLSILVGQHLRVEWNFRKLLGGNTCGFGLKLNSTQILTNTQLVTATGADDGSAYLGFAAAANAADTGRGIGFYQLTAIGGTTVFPQVGGRPQATITSVTITAINNTASSSATVTSVRILTGIM